MNPQKFDYSAIPEGYYHHLVESGGGIRKAWHLQKFERVLEYLKACPGEALLDIGCFAGTFLSLVPPSLFKKQEGVDILESQIRFANEHFGADFRKFTYIKKISDLDQLEGQFDCVTLIEVIEHLSREEIRELIAQVDHRLKPGGRFILSTPNYTSFWPVLEVLVNWLSDISHEEQHITKFNYFGCVSKLTGIAPMIGEKFELSFKTTTHFIAPFLAGISFNASMKLARIVSHRHWRNPFGNLILMGFVKR